MSSINNQPAANPLSISDLFILWSASGGDTRRVSIANFIAFLTTQLAGYLGAIRIFMPFVAGTANALQLTGPASVSVLTLDLGDSFTFIPLVDNTGATTVTMNVNGTPVTKALIKDAAPIGAGVLKAGVPTDILYDGTQFSFIR